MPRFRNMRERVEYAYDELNVDIYYEGELMYTILDHTRNQFIEMLNEEQLDHALEQIWMTLNIENVVTGSRV